MLITGGHSGIGLECVKRLVWDRPLNIVLAGRSPDRMKEVVGQLRQNGGTKISTLPLDTSSLTSVREAAARLRSMVEGGEIDTLQAILCNAGGRSFGPVLHSPEDYETTFAGNYLGHFLLVHLLVDSLAKDGRVVFTTSGTHDPDTRDGKAVGPAVEPDAWKLAKVGVDGGKPLSSGVRYATAKLCVILFAYELHRRLQRSGSSISSIAFDPGSVSGTSFLRGAPAPLRFIAGTSFARRLMKLAGITLGSLEVSGASLAKLATDTAYAQGSGRYFQVNDGSFGERRSATISYDEARAIKLWNASKQLVSLTTTEESPLLR
ncbi:SDR family NAD(P)-dependent oxidoreductase [Rhizobium bangladeshense]|uniref:SDR family NAD(P)-dependent oxidoreductase n=1 Tax=Rhizobium bangladeshense TaxID=1138189 RepID=UPI002180AB3C|nr:SDR family NAD(P)-dependent oxidoreductase [Rhizobium bangladeshense]